MHGQNVSTEIVLLQFYRVVFRMVNLIAVTL